MSLTLTITGGETGPMPGGGDALADVAVRDVAGAVARGMVLDGRVVAVGDALVLFLLHRRGPGSAEVRGLAAAITKMAAEVAGLARARALGAAAVVLGTRRHHWVELAVDDDDAAPVLCFVTNEGGPGAWNVPLCRTFADPFGTPGLTEDPSMHLGFSFEVVDLEARRSAMLACPRDLHELLLLAGESSRYAVRTVFASADHRVAAVADVHSGPSGLLAVRSGAGLPSVSELLEPFALPELPRAWSRRAHRPLLPVPLAAAAVDVPGAAEVVGLAFGVEGGRLVGPRDVFDDPVFDLARDQVQLLAGYQGVLGTDIEHRRDRERLAAAWAGVRHRLDGRWWPLPAAS